MQLFGILWLRYKDVCSMAEIHPSFIMVNVFSIPERNPYYNDFVPKNIYPKPTQTTKHSKLNSPIEVVVPRQPFCNYN